MAFGRERTDAERARAYCLDRRRPDRSGVRSSEALGSVPVGGTQEVDEVDLAARGRAAAAAAGAADVVAHDTQSRVVIGWCGVIARPVIDDVEGQEGLCGWRAGR